MQPVLLISSWTLGFDSRADSAIIGKNVSGSRVLHVSEKNVSGSGVLHEADSGAAILNFNSTGGFFNTHAKGYKTAALDEEDKKQSRDNFDVEGKCCMPRERKKEYRRGAGDEDAPRSGAAISSRTAPETSDPTPPISPCIAPSRALVHLRDAANTRGNVLHMQTSKKRYNLL
jgi:hypothetical protein